MTRIMLLAGFLVFSKQVTAQFPFLEGKDFSGTLTKLNDQSDGQYVLSFDASKTLLALSIIDQDTLQPRRSFRTDYDRNIRKLSVSADLDENVFTVYKEELQPGASLNYTWYWLRNKMRTQESDKWSYGATVVNFSIESQYTAFAGFNTDSTDIVVDNHIKTELGANIGYTYSIDDNEVGSNTIVALTLFAGGAFNSTLVQSKSQVVNRTASTVSGDEYLTESKSVYFTTPDDFLLIKPKFDFAQRLYTFESSHNQPGFNSPRIFLVFRYETSMAFGQINDQLRHSAYSGFSLTTVNNQTSASFLLEFGNIKSEDEYFAIKLYYGLPLK